MVPVSVSFKLLNVTGRVLSLIDPSSSEFTRFVSDQTVKAGADLQFFTGFTYLTPTSTRPDAFTIGINKDMFPQGNQVVLGNTGYKLVIKGLGVATSIMQTRALNHALGDLVPLTVLEGNRMLAVLAAYTRVKSNGV